MKTSSDGCRNVGQTISALGRMLTLPSQALDLTLFSAYYRQFRPPTRSQHSRRKHLISRNLTFNEFPASFCALLTVGNGSFPKYLVTTYVSCIACSGINSDPIVSRFF